MCDKNVEEIVTILPDSSDVEYILKCKAKISYRRSLKFGVDFNYIPINKNADFETILDKFRTQSNFKNILWSDSLTIP